MIKHSPRPRGLAVAIFSILGAMLTGPSGRAAQFGRVDIGDADDSKAMKKGIEDALGKIADQVKEAGEKALAEAKKGVDLTSGQKERIDEMLLKHGELQARLADVEKKQAASKDSTAADDLSRMSPGQQVAKSADLETKLSDLKSKSRSSVSFPVSTKSLTTVSAGAGIAPDFRPEIMIPNKRKFTVRDLMLPGSTSANAVMYVKETGFTNLAAPVSETVRKPQTDMVLSLVTQAVITLAHFAKASVQILDDVPQLESYIDGRLRYGLQFVEETQLLKGSGSGNNLNGIYTQATAYAAPTGFAPTASTRIDVLRGMMLQTFLAEYPATGIVLSPVDWANIETLKDTQGRYIIGNPASEVAAMLWALPVVETQAMGQGTALVGAFRPFSQIFDRMQAAVVIATENEDDFVKNMITIRAEERLAMAVYRPEAFVKNAAF